MSSSLGIISSTLIVLFIINFEAHSIGRQRGRILSMALGHLRKIEGKTTRDKIGNEFISE